MDGLTKREIKMLMESIPLARAQDRKFEWPWEVSARFNRETEQLKREAASANSHNANIAYKQLRKVKRGGSERYFTGC